MSDPQNPPPGGYPAPPPGYGQPPAPYPPPTPYPPPGYPPPGYQMPPPPKPNNGLAVGAMIAGIVGLFAVPIIGSILGIVLGTLAKRQIAESGGREGGEGMAQAGIITGWIGLALWVLFIVFFLILFIGLLNFGSEVVKIIPSISPTPL